MKRPGGELSQLSENQSGEKLEANGPGEKRPEERRNSGLNVALFLAAMMCFAASIVGLLTRPGAGWPRGAFALGMIINVVGLLLRRRASR